MSRILGIDPGLQTTGFGVIEADGPRLAYVASGTIKTTGVPGVATGDLPARIRIIFENVREVVQTYSPDCAAVEIVFVNVNPQSTLLLGQARGAALAVGNDTGPMHIAVAAGAPAVVLFSADSNPDLSAPRPIGPEQPVTILREMDLGDLAVGPVVEAALALKSR